MKNKKLPSTFSPYSPPYFYSKKPVENKEQLILESVKKWSDGETVEETATHKTIVHLESSYEGCYYESDTPDIVCEFRTYKKEITPNKIFNKELAAFKQARISHVKQLAEWKANKKIWDAQEAEKTLKREKALFIALKKKFRSEQK